MRSQSQMKPQMLALALNISGQKPEKARPETWLSGQAGPVNHYVIGWKGGSREESRTSVGIRKANQPPEHKLVGGKRS